MKQQVSISNINTYEHNSKANPLKILENALHDKTNKLCIKKIILGHKNFNFI